MADPIVFSVSPALVRVSPFPPAGYVYRINGFRSRDRYHNAASAHADARRTQVVGSDGFLEPLDRAVKYGRAPALTR